MKNSNVKNSVCLVNLNPSDVPVNDRLQKFNGVTGSGKTGRFVDVSSWHKNRVMSMKTRSLMDVKRGR